MYGKPKRVAIIGCQKWDIFGIYSLAKSDAVDEVILVGERNVELASKTNRLLDENDVRRKVQLFAGSYSDAADADIAVIAVESEKLEGDSSIIHLRKTAVAVSHTVRALLDTGFQGIILMITNPIPLMANLAQSISGFATGRVIGLGTSNDGTAVLSPLFIGKASWCTGEDPTIMFVDNCDPVCPSFEKVLRNVRRTSIRHHPGNRLCSLATCVTRICEAILRDEATILPVSTLANGQYGVSGIYMTLPAVIGRQGVERIVALPTTNNERKRMRSYAERIRSMKQGVFESASALNREVA